MTRKNEGKTGQDVIPDGTFAHGVDVEELDTLTRKTLISSGKYSRVSRIVDGRYINWKTRMIYSAYWGNGDNKRQVVIKVDLPDYALGPRAQEHFATGNNTEKEIANLMGIDHPNLARLRDFYQVQASTGEKVHISVEDCVSGAQTLEERVIEDPLSDREAMDVFGGLIDGLVYLHKDRGMLHRDLNFGNILIARAYQNKVINPDGAKNRLIRTLRDPKLRAVITDFANAGRVEGSGARALPSSGGHLVTDPFIYEELTGKPGRYNAASEIYAVGANMFYALTGKSIFDCEVFGGKRADAVIGGRKISLLDANGHIDAGKFREAIRENLRGMTNGARYRKIIENCLTAPLGKGYTDIEELKRDFDKLKPSPARKWALAAGAAALLAGGALTAAFGFGYDAGKTREQLRTQQEMQEIERGFYGVERGINDSEREFLRGMKAVDQFNHEAEKLKLRVEMMQANPATKIIPDEAWEEFMKKEKEREEKAKKELEQIEKLEKAAQETLDASREAGK
ncbi:MAG: hypothetical protein MUF61_01625 [archaeon]|jgi:serine/threonine protein kinase|nr:hypothetical protein [archaeon]